MIVWRDGDFVPADEAVSAADRGYLVGDGVFETLLVDRGRPAFLGAHLTRLNRGARTLEIKIDLAETRVRAAIIGLSERLGLDGRAACRVTVSRVGGARGLAPSPDARSQAIISLQGAAPAKPLLTLIVAQARRLSSAPTNAFKCIGSYAPNLLARLAAARAGADEALLLNEHGRLACASAANVFLLTEQALISPPESEGAMPGVTRAILLAAAAEIGVATRVEPIEPSALGASGLMLTNSLIGVANASLLNAPEPTGDLAMRLASAYDARLRAEFSERAP